MQEKVEAANTRQVGGDHYSATYQHWDYVTDIGMNYLHAQVIKYLMRWRKKNGMQDVEKALHFLEKSIEVAPMLAWTQCRTISNEFVMELTYRFIRSCDLEPTEPEGRVMLSLANWTSTEQLHRAAAIIRDMIADGT